MAFQKLYRAHRLVNFLKSYKKRQRKRERLQLNVMNIRIASSDLLLESEAHFKCIPE